MPFEMEWQVLEGTAGTGASASGAGTTSALAATRFRERPAHKHRQVADMGSTNDFHKTATSGVMVGPFRGSGLQGQVTTATPFAPQGAGHQEGQLESTVDIGPGIGVKTVCCQRA